MELDVYRDEQGIALVDLPGMKLPDADTPAPVRFLPTWDATLLVHCRRSGILPEAFRTAIFHTKIPQSVGTVLVDGSVAATWAWRDDQVEVDELAKLTAVQRRGGGPRSRPIDSLLSRLTAADDQVGNEAGPSRLVRRAQPACPCRRGSTREMGSARSRRDHPGTSRRRRTPARRPSSSAKEDLDQPRIERVGDLSEGQLDARPGGVLDSKVVAEESGEAADAFDHDVVHGEPHRPAPVGVAAEQTARGIARRVVDRVGHAAEIDRERVLTMRGR